MDRITKVYFDPLATTKAQIRVYLETLPAGSAHPFKAEQILLLRTATGIDEIDISSYPEEYFFNAVDLGALGEALQQRMTKFEIYLRLFNEEYIVQQAPASTFRVPLSDEIAIFAVSERQPTYYDLCIADAEYNTSCYCARDTFPGVTHSGDINQGASLLHHIKINERQMRENKPYAVFVSGYQYTKLTRFREHNPVVLVANHAEKVLYIVPVPLDAASIGDAILCSPMVIKRDGDSLICSILPTPTTDQHLMCSGKTLHSRSFKEAIDRADFTMVSTAPATEATPIDATPDNDITMNESETTSILPSVPNAVLATQNVSIPSVIERDTAQIIRFGTGIEFMAHDHDKSTNQSSAVVLPCIFGSRLEGPMLLATGSLPLNVPFLEEAALHAYYEQLDTVVVIVDNRMTDNARNLATSWRINAIFLVQFVPEKDPEEEEVVPLLNSLSINAVTALAGPQSLVLVQISEKYYFYRGIANNAYLKTSGLEFGQNVTETINSIGFKSLLDPRAKRLVDISKSSTVLLPTSGNLLQVTDLEKLFQELPIEQISSSALADDISAIVPQLQILLNQKSLHDVSSKLISTLSSKVSNETAPLRNAYMRFLSKEYQSTDPESVRRKAIMLGEFRGKSRSLQSSLESIISHLSNMISSQTTSKRTHDLQRLVRQTAIQNNVEAVKNMTFDTLAGFLETHAVDMGVLLLNIETEPFVQLLGELQKDFIDASLCCDLDSRVLFLEGFDAGIIIEQSQTKHDGPLQNQQGPSHPILALPYLNQERGSGSMLAWVCWDEFVNLENPFSVRWMDKCNEPHIAALRIMMRDTLSHAVVSREFNLQPGGLETGHLMSALLMAAMHKLAAMRTTAPTVTKTAEDTVTKLMRGLFGNLLTTAGSGVRPLSMVWQLLGTYPQLEVPSTYVDWSWYEIVVRLYPYSGWPLKLFYRNLEKLLDKTIIRVVTKNEQINQIKSNRADEMVKYCKLRNIQLEHSRTIITVFMRMLTEDVDRRPIAGRLLKVLPESLEKETESYRRMLRYVKHLAKGGKRRVDDDLVAASVYTKRSAAFSDLKNQVAKACESKDHSQIKALCQEVVNKHAAIAKLWNVKPASLKLQNLDVYKSLIEASFDTDDDFTRTHNNDLFYRVNGDAEHHRLAWQIGTPGQFGHDIEPVDEAFVHEMMTGETDMVVASSSGKTSTSQETLVKKEPEGLAQFSKVVQPKFITAVEKALTGGDVCVILNIPKSTMEVFVKALNPTFNWDDLALNFRAVVISLLKNRKDREATKPTRKLLGLDDVTVPIAIDR